MSSEAVKGKGGRPRLYPGTERRPTLSFRVRDGLHERISRAAKDGERSISEEIERRLMRSFEEPDLAERVADAVARRLANQD